MHEKILLEVVPGLDMFNKRKVLKDRMCLIYCCIKIWLRYSKRNLVKDNESRGGVLERNRYLWSASPRVLWCRSWLLGLTINNAQVTVIHIFMVEADKINIYLPYK